MTFEERKAAALELAALSEQVASQIDHADLYAESDLGLLFGDIGRAMTRKRSRLPDSDYVKLFAQIEALLRGDDQKLSNAVAVGLLWQIAAAVVQSGFPKEVIDRHAGPNARSYLKSFGHR